MTPESAMANPVAVPPDTVVVDTDAFSVVFVRPLGPRAARSRLDAESHRLRLLLTGRTIVIALQTRAELLAGPLIGNWGPERTAQLRQIVDNTPTIPVTEEVVQAYARLTAECRALGHALGQPDHAADRWIAATAIAFDSPLLPQDRIYRGAPWLRILG